MLSRRNAWLLIALPIALILLWASQRTSASLDATPTAYPDLSGSLLYLAPTNAPADLFAFDPATLQSTQLTEGAQITSFQIAADGQQIYFAASNATSGADIWRMQIADRSLSRLIDCGTSTCDVPQARRDGRYLAYTGLDSASALPQIWLHDFETQQQSPMSLSGQSALNPQWALDGRLSYYNQNAAAYELMQPGSTARLRTPNALGDVLTWRPDGASFVAAEAFASTADILRGTTGEASLQTPDPESQSALAITVTALLRYSNERGERLFDYGDELIEDAAPLYSPDGRWLAFTRKYLDEARWTPGRQLWLLNVQSGEIMPLTDQANYQIAHLAWSADSRQLAFVRSNRTDFNQPPEIWVMQRDGASAQLLVVDAFAPQWLP